MGGVVVRDTIHDAFMSGPEHVVELTHGYTYSAHPLACAAGLATLDIYRDEKLFERARALEEKFADAVPHATVDEVANMVVYLCSEQASATTGAALRVDGGMLRSIA